MDYGIKLRTWGSFACFTRPEMKAERVSYDVMTPSAARGILEAIYWEPKITWVIDRIHVLNEIKFTNIRRNELSDKIPVTSVKKAMTDLRTPLHVLIEEKRQLRSSTILRDVDYVIEAHFVLNQAEDKNTAKHLEMFRRRAKKGQFFHQPYFGCREFPVHFEWIDKIPQTRLKNADQKLGWMLLDINFMNDYEPLFFNAEIGNGVIHIPLINDSSKMKL